MAGELVQIGPPESIPQARVDATNRVDSNVAQADMDDEASDFSEQWNHEVDYATRSGMDALLSYSRQSCIEERSYRMLGVMSAGFREPQSPSTSSKELIVPTMTPLTDEFFTRAEDEYDYLPIIGPGTTTTLAEAARSMERDVKRRMSILGNMSGSNTNAEIDVLEVETDIILALTRCVTQTLAKKGSMFDDFASFVDSRYGSAICTVEDAFTALKSLGECAPRRVCQHPFRKNDIVWVCRTCQADETCVLCHACWSDSDHVGHDTSFYHAQAGGCCDCGDPDAWDPAGFCSKHGPSVEAGDGSIDILPDDNGRIKGLPWPIVAHSRGVVTACLDWLVDKIAIEASKSFVTIDGDKINLFGCNESTIINSSEAEIFDDISLGSSSSESTTHYEAQAKQSVEYLIGERGRIGRGLFLIVHGSDVVSTMTLINALRALYSSQQSGFMMPSNAGLDSSSTISDAILKKISQVIQSTGDVVLLGTNEILHAIGASQCIMSHLWRDGDEITLKKIGEVMIRWTKILASAGIPCSVKTLNQLQDEQQAYAILEWLGHIARCDAFCEQISLAASQDRHLVPMLNSDLRLPRRITRAYHSLQLTLLVVPDFKKQLANVYCDTYEAVTAEYARGIGIAECSSYTLSVQFLNRQTYVQDLAINRNLLLRLSNAFLITLRRAIDTKAEQLSLSSTQQKLNPNHPVLINRRYSPVVSDLKCVLNVDGMPQRFCYPTESKFPLQVWIEALSLSQCLDGQVWRLKDQGHVEMEDRGWVGAFNLSISLNSLFERILAWEEKENTVNSPILRSASMLDVSILVLEGVDRWHMINASHERYSPTSDPSTVAAEMVKLGSRARLISNPFDVEHRCTPCALPVCSTSVQFGMRTLALPALSVSQVCPVSFHIPLHRFFGSCLRELCSGTSLVNDSRSVGIVELVDRVHNSKSNISDTRKLYQLLMDFPMLVLSRAAQIRAGFWKRNGQGMLDQVLNYVEPPFCRGLRDADLLVVQFAVLAYIPFGTTSNSSLTNKESVGSAYLMNLMLHRFGVFEFLGFTPSPSLYHDRYFREVDSGYYLSEIDNSRSSDLPLKRSIFPWSYSPAGRMKNFDVAGGLALLEEFLHILIILITELPSPPITVSNISERKVEQAKQARVRLRREVIHRLASGPKPFSELAEVHHVLSQRDNNALSEEGRLHNPDEAAEAALHSMLSEVANELPARGFESKRWELRKDLWCEYDPSFFHIGQRAHQGAAELRPGSKKVNESFHALPKPYCPRPSKAHPSFGRLRRDFSADAALVATIYRVLHVHCSDNISVDSISYLRGKEAYQKSAMSETALARVVHLLTLGIYSWDDDEATCISDWQKCGGHGEGSIFSNCDAPPTVNLWINFVLLNPPSHFMGDDLYDDEPCMLLLLKKLAVGQCSRFEAQDGALCYGAAWICDFATKHNSKASKLLDNQLPSIDTQEPHETELDRRKRLAKEKYMKMMSDKASKFMTSNPEMFDGDKNMDIDDNEGTNLVLTPATLDNSTKFQSQSEQYNDDLVRSEELKPLRELPLCIICNVDNTGGSNDCQSNELVFCAHAQGSTVLKGGGGPQHELNRFVGIHISLCGHAVHYSCCEAYLKSVAGRESNLERNENVKKGEFRCPCCQRLSNFLVPFVNVTREWAGTSKQINHNTHDASFEMDIDEIYPISTYNSSKHIMPTLDMFLKKGRWTSDFNWDIAGDTDKYTEKCDNDLDDGLDSKRKRTPRFRRGFSFLTRRSSRRRIKSTDSEENIFINYDFLGATEVWHQFISRLCDISYGTDRKRLGSDFEVETNEIRDRSYEFSFTSNFRSSDGTESNFSPVVEQDNDLQRMESERNDFISSLFVTIQAFVYSCCAEAAEIRRYARIPNSDYRQKYGIKDVQCDELFVSVYPSASDDNINELFQGKLGRLRNLSLAIMALSGTVTKDIIHQSFLSRISKPHGKKQAIPRFRPLLQNHVMSLTVASVFACCGQRVGDYCLYESNSTKDCILFSESSIEDSFNVVKMGFLARVLQTLVAKLDFKTSMSWSGKKEKENSILSAASVFINKLSCSHVTEKDTWKRSCIELLVYAIKSEGDTDSKIKDTSQPDHFQQILDDACDAALRASEIFLSDMCLIMQIIIPNTARTFEMKSTIVEPSLLKLSTLMSWFQFEPITEIARSKHVQFLVRSWYEDAIIIDQASSGDYFRSIQWPLYPDKDQAITVPKPIEDNLVQTASPSFSLSKSPIVYSPTSSYWLDRSMLPPKSVSKNCAPLLGTNLFSDTKSVPRIGAVPTSYTDLYAAIGFLCPDNEQAAVCLICGEILDAGGKGECTSHALKCGGGCGIFFLLQECSSLILHGNKAAYLNSPYVDSHGETPQYRGRPLNLDIQRYEILREMWSGHLVREKVMSERATVRHLIISNFY